MPLSRMSVSSKDSTATCSEDVGALPPMSDSAFWDKSCNWCGLTRRSPNPLHHKYMERQQLPWRRPDGQECLPCSYYIAAAYPTPEQKTTLARQLKETDEARAVFSKGRLEWISRFNASPNGRVVKTSLDMDLRVQIQSTHGFKMTENCGVWWPRHLAIEAGVDVRKSEIVWIGGDDGTPKRAGIIRDSEHGQPTDCIKLEKYVDKAAKKIDHKGAASSELRAG